MPKALSAQPEAPWSAGLRGARANLVPGLVLQLFALTLLLAYYNHAPTREWCTRLATFRSEKGFLFSIVSTGIFGGILPCLYLKLNPATRNQYDFKQNLTLIVFWAYKGIEVDLFYSLLARLIGTGNGFRTIAIKTFIDQFIVSPFYFVPITVIVYGWLESHFNTAAIIADLKKPRWYQRSALSMLISNLGVWLPTVCIIYSLPSALQLPLFSIVLCFFTLIVAHVAGSKKPAPVPS